MQRSNYQYSPFLARNGAVVRFKFSDPATSTRQFRAGPVLPYAQDPALHELDEGLRKGQELGEQVRVQPSHAKKLVRSAAASLCWTPLLWWKPGNMVRGTSIYGLLALLLLKTPFRTEYGLDVFHFYFETSFHTRVFLLWNLLPYKGIFILKPPSVQGYFHFETSFRTRAFLF